MYWMTCIDSLLLCFCSLVGARRCMEERRKYYMRTYVGFVCTNCTNMMKTCIVLTNMNGKSQDGIRDAYVVMLLV
jgi:hypothetical protein